MPLRLPLLFFAALARPVDLARVDLPLFADDEDFAFDAPLPLLRLAVVDFFGVDFFAAPREADDFLPPPALPPPVRFLFPLLLLPARFFVPADFAMKPPSGDGWCTP
jgi:hypothetical protein